MNLRSTWSAASRVLLLIVCVALGVGAVSAALLAFEAQRDVRREAARLTAVVSTTLARSPTVLAALDPYSPVAASELLQPYVSTIISTSELDFITVMEPDGARITHPDLTQIGKVYLGTIPPEPQSLTEEFTGTLGPSIRTITPVSTTTGEVAGWVAAGITIQTLSQSFLSRLPIALGIMGLIFVVGTVGAILASRATRRIAGDWTPARLASAISTHESLRTLGEALRAQTHEHANRMHTATALLELGRVQEAINILVESSAQSQLLVDQVTERRAGDPTVGALLLGKASQAKERGIKWLAEIDPAAPRSNLSAVDSVSVLGNLIDNALDAAADSSGRWVRVAVQAIGGGNVMIEVIDSGDGVPAELEAQVFELGFSTKDFDVQERGVGLHLVRALVLAAGGTIELESNPTTFRVTLQGRGEGDG